MRSSRWQGAFECRAVHRITTSAPHLTFPDIRRDIKTRLIDNQPDANNAQSQAALGGRPAAGGVKVGANQANNNNSSGCC